MTFPQIIERPSPNFNDRPDGAEPDMLVVHYTGMKSAEVSLTRLCDPMAKVSAHYLVDEDGALFQMVDETKRAWHAGVSYWAGNTDINSCSVGIELQNPGHEFGYRAFPDPQMDTLIILCKQILSRQAIPSDRILGHSDVAPSRKEDPGELFDWERLAAAGIGRMPDQNYSPTGLDAEATRTCLTKIGYNPEVSFSETLTAFQRHYRQSNIDGQLDEETTGLVQALVAR